MPMVLSANRANQKSAIGLSSGLFSGGIAIDAKVTDIKNLKFQANVTFQTGDVASPYKTFTPSTDDGEVKTFSALDDIIKWVNGAFNDVQTISINIDEAVKLSKAFVPPTDPIADALKQKTKFQKLKDGLLDNKTNALAKVQAAEAQGYHTSPNAALLALYASLVTKKNAVLAIETYYTNEIARFNAIV
ncbi:hypothetical protein [Methylotenera sp.]|uniref:hypothetical protein n=1 Tax=Methylotenera sp. TaxID=2051956 RepID=UPI00272F03B3|nr:hypothetical protein [Methylotenera sp.]MDP2071567.1 hypothetical protein [Methylotenera sp.]MDP3006658.1 hypothetical protein [Methylotenera sp.]